MLTSKQRPRGKIHKRLQSKQGGNMKKTLIFCVFVVFFFSVSGIASAYSIVDDATGGDCTIFGNWDASSKTCTLTTDLPNLSQAIFILSPDVTLDGNGHALSGGHYGVYALNISRVTIKNLNLENFWVGIVIWGASNCVVKDNVIRGSSGGISVVWSDENTITGNKISVTKTGIGPTGIILNTSNYNIVSDNVVTDGTSGIMLYVARGNSIMKNTIANPKHYGLILNHSHETIITGNTVSDVGEIVLLMSNTSDNVVYRNNFLRNRYSAMIYFANENNVFNLDYPYGGNYWDKYDSPDEGCYDADTDGFCDSPYIYKHGQYDPLTDYLPWTMQDAWLTPEEIISKTVAELENLLSTGELNTGTATGLSATLTQAANQFDRDNTTAAEKQLGAFIRQVQGQLNAGNISQATADELIAAAQEAIEKIQ
jgi:parallel beta-helix repeat protein